VAARLDRIAVLQPYSEALSVGLVVLLITYFSLVLGELAPKHIALSNAERVAAAIAPPMKFLSRITGPVVQLLSFSTDLVLRLLGVRPTTEPNITEEEIRILIGQGTETGVFEPIEEEIVEQVFRLGDRKVSALTTRYPDVVWLDIDDPVEVNRQKILDSRYGQYPVAQGSLDNLLGYPGAVPAGAAHRYPISAAAAGLRAREYACLRYAGAVQRIPLPDRVCD
jgi:putative hemolysin